MDDAKAGTRKPMYILTYKDDNKKNSKDEVFRAKISIIGIIDRFRNEKWLMLINLLV